MAKKQLSKHDLVQAVQQLTIQLGRQPKYREFVNAFKGHEYWLGKHFLNYSNLLIEVNDGAPKITPPEFPEGDIPITEVIDMMAKRFTKRNQANEAKQWMTFKVATDKPIGICWFGDPHIDDDGCNWPLLKEHIELCKKTEGLFGANIGDVHNNWVGRLTQEYANQSTTRETAFQLIEWFLQDSGIDWLIWLMGNHDAWNSGLELMSKIAKHKVTLVDWKAQFKLKFSNGRECLIDAAHNHAGHSQWNPLHGQQKASTMGGTAHLYMAGHLHTWALAQHECPHTHRVYWLARCRGYKFIDDYAHKLGFGSQKFGASIVSVIDPKADDVNMVRCFADVAEGAQYLTWLRKRNK